MARDEVVKKREKTEKRKHGKGVFGSQCSCSPADVEPNVSLLPFSLFELREQN